MKQGTRKLRRRRSGFTLAEVLIALLILLMVTAVVAAGIPMATEAYYKIVDGANAEVLLSTTMTRLRTELTNVTSEPSFPADTDTVKKAVQYTNGLTGYTSVLSLSADGKIWLNAYDEASAEYSVVTASRPVSSLLISDQAATNGLYATYDKITYNQATGLFAVENLRVMKNGRTLTKLETFEIRPLALSRG